MAERERRREVARAEGAARYERRLYRLASLSSDLVPFRVQIKESDLLVLATRNLADEAFAALARVRSEVEEWVARHPEFAASFAPLEPPGAAVREGGAGAVSPAPGVPEPVLAMYRASVACGVGPMAAVAGAVAESVGRALLPLSREVIVENGGDIFAAVRRRRVARVFAGGSPLSGTLGIVLEAGSTCGVCTSSGTVGPSASFGRADAAVVVADDAAVADAAATAVANRVRKPSDVPAAVEFARTLPIRGVLVIVGDTLGAAGDIELVPVEPGE